MGRAEINNAEQAEPSAATRELADWVVSIGADDIGAVPRAWATDAVLDWFGVTVAGSREPLSHILEIGRASCRERVEIAGGGVA